MNTATIKKPYNNLKIYYIQGVTDTSDVNEDPDFIGNWVEDGFSFLFFNRERPGLVKNLLRSQKLNLIDKYEMTYDQWHGGELLPFTAGTFIVSPPWVKTSETGSHQKIIIDPGVVFGNGNHPTTNTCLELLNEAFESNDIKSSIDIGTGTGLLSIAAAFSGSKKNLAVDFNYLAAKTAANNISLNGLSSKIISFQGCGEDFIFWPCDLLIANIHYDVMKKLILQKGFLNKNFFILSGLLRSQSFEIEKILSTLPVRILEKTSPDGIWFNYYGKIGI